MPLPCASKDVPTQWITFELGGDDSGTCTLEERVSPYLKSPYGSSGLRASRSCPYRRPRFIQIVPLLSSCAVHDTSSPPRHVTQVTARSRMVLRSLRATHAHAAMRFVVVIRSARLQAALASVSQPRHAHARAHASQRHRTAPHHAALHGAALHCAAPNHTASRCISPRHAAAAPHRTSPHDCLQTTSPAIPTHPPRMHRAVHCLVLPRGSARWRVKRMHRRLRSARLRKQLQLTLCHRVRGVGDAAARLQHAWRCTDDRFVLHDVPGRAVLQRVGDRAVPILSGG